MFKANILLICKCIIVLGVAYSRFAHAEVYLDVSNKPINKIPTNDYKLHIGNAYKLNTSTLKGKNPAVKSSILPYNNEVLDAAKQTAMDPALIHAIMTVESNHKLHARSKRGAYGLMQLMPDTARRYKVLNRGDPKQNILGGAKYLRELIELYDGDISLAIAAYNAGPGAIKKYSGKIPPYKETAEYVPKVMKFYKQYS